jgi:Leucine-rich repeat (LRR) protein
VRRLAEVRGLKKLDLSFTYVTDKGMEWVPRLTELEELTLDTAEFITDAAINHLRANRRLRKLVLRGTDITDVALPYIGELTALRTLDLSHSMLGDVGIESLPSLTQLEELDLGATRITGINLHLLKLLPKLRVLRLKGIQRRNGGVCWTPTILDRDLDSLALLTGLEELNLGAGIGLGVKRQSTGRGETNCTLTGGIRITDVGLAKLGKLRALRHLELSGAPITTAGLGVLRELPKLERLSLWNCTLLDDGAGTVLAGLSKLRVLDLSDTRLGDAALEKLFALPDLKRIYLTDTRITQSAAERFRAGRFVSWAQRPGASQ